MPPWPCSRDMQVRRSDQQPHPFMVIVEFLVSCPYSLKIEQRADGLPRGHSRDPLSRSEKNPHQSGRARWYQRYVIPWLT